MPDPPTVHHYHKGLRGRGISSRVRYEAWDRQVHLPLLYGKSLSLMILIKLDRPHTL